jgi:hypothetical protein
MSQVTLQTKEERSNITLSAQRWCFASTVSLYAKNVNNSEVMHFSITKSRDR